MENKRAEKKKTILLSSVIVTAVMLLIKVLGLIKQSVIAGYCGATEDSDIFFVATGIIGQLSTAIFSAISVSLLTTFTKEKIEFGKEKSNLLINGALRVFIPATVIIVLLINVLAMPISRLLAPNYGEDSLYTLALNLRLLSLVLIPTCFEIILNVCLESERIFVPGRLQTFFISLFIIIAGVWFYGRFGVTALVASYLIACVFHAVMLALFAIPYFKPTFKRTGSWKSIKRILFLSLPLIIGNAAYEINDIIDKQISLSMGEGFASVLNYGASINEIVTGLVVSSVSIVLFANFSRLVAENKNDELVRVLKTALEGLTVIILPIMVLCIVSGKDIIRILFFRGKFDESALDGTYQVLIGYSAGFIFQAVRIIMVKTFYAHENTKIPTISGLVSVAVNIGLNYLLSYFWGIIGIAIATSISMLLSSVILFVYSKKIMPEFSVLSLGKEIGKGVLALIVAFIPYFLLHEFTSYNVYLKFVVEALVCIGFYLFGLIIFKSNTLKIFSEKIFKKHVKEEVPEETPKA